MSELNRKAAELMGYNFWDLKEENNYTYPLYLIDPSDGRIFVAYADGEPEQLFDPEHNRNHCNPLLDKVAEEGKEVRYRFLRNLLKVINKASFSGTDFMWLALTATPAQITEAFCKTMEEANE